uniref:Fibronectin type-III domain-containing protein n=1 Tax=Syphacia muris TaxID=451379 RepID=A0A0N5A7W2_9BILA
MRILKLFWLTAGLILLLFTSRTATYREFKYAPNRPDDIGSESDSNETTAPDSPINVRCVASTYSVILYWDHPISKDRTKVRGYSIEWGIGSPSYNSLVPDTETSYSINELKPNTTYTFGIFAFNDVGDSKTVEITATTTPAENRESIIVLLAPIILSIKVLSTTSVEVHWKDPNIYYKYDDSTMELMEDRKLYYIKYGIDQTNIFNEIASKNDAAVITNLKPGYIYTIMVRISVNDEQSPWSIKKSVKMPQKSLIFGQEITKIECNFEKTDQCQFVTDKNSLLKWYRMTPKPDKKHPQHNGHYMLLKSLDVNTAGHSKLVSNQFKVENCKQICISFRVYNKKIAKGKLRVKVLDNDFVQDDSASTVYLERLEKLSRNVWQHIFVNVDNHKDKFKVLFDVQKDIGKPLWLAIADISLQCKACQQQTRKYPKYYNNLSGNYFIRYFIAF